jgi:hypothetical protein
VQFFQIGQAVHRQFMSIFLPGGSQCFDDSADFYFSFCGPRTVSSPVPSSLSVKSGRKLNSLYLFLTVTAQMHCLRMNVRFAPEAAIEPDLRLALAKPRFRWLRST